MRQTLRPRSARWAAAVVSVITLVWLVSSAHGTPAGAAAHSQGRTPAEPPAVALAGAPCALGTSQASVVTDTTAAAHRAERGRTDSLIAATPVPRSLPRTGAPARALRTLN